MISEQTEMKLRRLGLDGMAEAYNRQRSGPTVLPWASTNAWPCWSTGSGNTRRTRRCSGAWLCEAAAERRPGGYRLGGPARPAPRARRPTGHRGLAAPSPALPHHRTHRVGKSWIACALAQKACRDGYRVLYLSAAKLFRDLLAASSDGSLSRFIRRLTRPHLLVVDDWGMDTVRRSQYRDFLELLEERHDKGPCSSPANCRPMTGTSWWTTPPSPTPSSTGSCTAPTASAWTGNR